MMRAFSKRQRLEPLRISCGPTLSGSGGFTLIELMIVVGIIGIMVSISAPLYERYQAKARQAEAKVALCAIYSLEKSFNSEYSAYVSSFDALGYTPEGSRRFYTVGWNATQTDLVQGYTGSLGTPNVSRVNVPVSWTPCDAAQCIANYLTAPAVADAQTLSVGACGYIRQNANCDYWSINENKNLTNPQSGL